MAQNSVDSLLLDLELFPHELRKIEEAYNKVNGILKGTFGTEAFIVGATLSNTSLPDEPIEVTQLLPRKQCDTWSVQTNQVLCKEANTLFPPIISASSRSERNQASSLRIDEIVYLAHGETIQCRLCDTIRLRISANNLSSIFLAAVVEDFNRVVGRNNLLKRSLLLIKAWCTYESRRFSAIDLLEVFNHDAMVVLTMMIFVKNDPSSSSRKEGGAGGIGIAASNETMCLVDHPLTALQFFLQQLAEFDWRSYAVTATGRKQLAHIEHPIIENNIIAPVGGRLSPTNSVGSEKTNVSIYSDDGYLYNSNIQLDDSNKLKDSSSSSTYMPSTGSSRKGDSSFSSSCNQPFESIAMQHNSLLMDDTSNGNLPSIFSDSGPYGSSNPPLSSQKMPHSPPRHNQHAFHPRTTSQRSLKVELENIIRHFQSRYNESFVEEDVTMDTTDSSRLQSLAYLEPRDSSGKEDPNGDSLKTTSYDSMKTDKDDSNKTITYNKKSASPAASVRVQNAAMNGDDENEMESMLHIMDPIVKHRNICSSTRAALYHISQRSRLPEVLASLLRTASQDLQRRLNSNGKREIFPLSVSSCKVRRDRRLLFQGTEGKVDTGYEPMKSPIQYSSAFPGLFGDSPSLKAPAEPGPRFGMGPYEYSNFPSTTASSTALAPVLRRVERQPSCLPFFELTRQDEETYSVAALAVENIIKQAELVSSTKITTETIISLVKQVLQQHGALPIGEIGKQLQIKTGNSDFPKLLKKGFSGLKKFISNHPDLFRFGDNHNFNPVVYLVDPEKERLCKPIQPRSNSSFDQDYNSSEYSSTQLLPSVKMQYNSSPDYKQHGYSPRRPPANGYPPSQDMYMQSNFSSPDVSSKDMSFRSNYSSREGSVSSKDIIVPPPGFSPHHSTVAQKLTAPPTLTQSRQHSFFGSSASALFSQPLPFQQVSRPAFNRQPSHQGLGHAPLLVSHSQSSLLPLGSLGHGVLKRFSSSVNINSSPSIAESPLSYDGAHPSIHSNGLQQHQDMNNELGTGHPHTHQQHRMGMPKFFQSW